MRNHHQCINTIQNGDMIDMIISFDLDGTIYDSDWGWLDALRDKGWPQDEEEKYYACREKILDPYRFLGKDDIALILTGRPIHLKGITEKWLKKNGLGSIELVFTKTLKGYPTADKEEFKALGEGKAKFFIDKGIQVHFDDNEQVVDSMRKAFPNIVVLHVGWHVAW
jgi:phosphoglycolate phosphatase-like HAD superfamily hydrolase